MLLFSLFPMWIYASSQSFRREKAFCFAPPLFHYMVLFPTKRKLRQYPRTTGGAVCPAQNACSQRQSSCVHRLTYG